MNAAGPRRRWSVRIHLYFLAAVVAVPLAVLLVWAAAAEYRKDRLAAEGQARFFAQVVARDVARYLENTRQALDQLAGLPTVRTLDRVETEESLEVVLGLHPEFRDLIVTDAAGRTLNTPREHSAAVPQPPADGRWWQVVAAPDGSPELMLTAPIIAKDGADRGRVVALVDLSVLATRLLPAGEDAPETQLLLRDATVLLKPGRSGARVGARFDEPGGRRDLARGEVQQGGLPGPDGLHRFYVIEPVAGIDAGVCAVVPRDEISRLARRTLLGNLAAITLGVIVLATLVHRLAQRITRPMEALTAAAFAAPERAADVPEGGPREIAEAVAAFNAMRAQQRDTGAALRRGEAFFRGVFDDGGGAVLISGPDRRIERANTRACTLLGFTAAELCQRSWLDLTHPDDRPAGEDRWARLQRGEIDGYDIDKRYLRKDGTVLEIAVAVNCLRGADGRVERLVAHLTDLTARKRGEQRLRESEQRLELALRGGDLGWWDYDLATQTAVANARFTELLGLPPGAYEANPLVWRERVHPEDRAACLAAFRAHLENRTAFYEAEHRMVRPDGTEWWVLDRGCVTARNAAGAAVRVSGTIRDITLRKRAELGLAAERQRFEELVQAVDGIVWEQEVASGRCTFVSRRAEHILGFPVARWLEEENFWEAHLHADDRRWAPALRAAESAGRKARDFVYRMVAADGRTVWMHETLSAATDAAGRPVRRRGVLLDVTARRLAEERLGAVVRALPDVIFLIDAHGVLLECLTGAPELLPAPRETLLGRHHGEFLPAELTARVASCFAELRAGAEFATLSYETAAGGAVQHFEARCVPCEGDRVLLIVRDVTSRATAEAALRESEARYRAVVEQTGQMVYEAELATRTVRWYGAGAVAAITGWTLAEFASVDLDRWLELVHPDDRDAVGAEFAACCASGQPFRAEYRFAHRDGSHRVIEDLAVFLRDAAGRPVRVVGRMHDLTDARREQAERERFARKLQETQKLESLGVLAGGIAHDFNNLLTGILGNASLLRLELPARAPALESVDDIEKAAQAAAELCKQMLAYSGKGRRSVQRLDLTKLVETCASLLQISVSKRAHLHFLLAPDLPALEADASQLRQILMNFTINASEAIESREGRIVIATGVVDADRACLAGMHLAGDLPEGRYVFLEVSDNGCGMAPETAARIFDPFFTTKFTGRGLGLAAVLGIVRGHRGAIRVESRPGEGSVFRVLLPAAAAADRPVAAVEEPAPPPGSFGGAVLVADDEAAVRKVAVRLLTSFGCACTTAEDGLAAVQAFGAEPAKFRFVLLDLTMPAMDGREAFRLLREIRPDVPVVFMSGFSAQDATELFGTEPATMFLQKPFSAETLAQAVHTVLSAPRA